MSELKRYVNNVSWTESVSQHKEAIIFMHDRQIKDLEAQLAEAREIVKAVAHIGIDWGYGKFELTDEHIDKARRLYEQLKEKGYE